MSKKILLIIALVVIMGALIAFTFIFNHPPKSPAVSNNIGTTTQIVDENKSTVSTTSQAVKVQPISVKDTAWAVFQKYLSYNKDHNLNAVKGIVYKVNSVCTTAVASDECKNRMDSAYSYGSAFKKEDFTNVWSDNKQTILSTDFKIGEDNNFIGRTRDIIFFIGNSSDLKLLSFSPSKGAILPKATSTREELLKKLTLYTEDNDQDGIADYDEQCVAPPTGQTCTKTSPTLRDTNGNGLWDGVDALINQMK
jgi:hypothetical protein